LIWISVVGNVATGEPETSADRAALEESGESPQVVWVQQLDSAGFLDRKEATERLIESGLSAIQPICTAMASGSREVVSRGIFILRQLALSKEAAVEIAGLTALEDLASAQKNPASSVRSATRALNQVFRVRQEGALEHLKGAGATVDAMETINGPFQAVIIGQGNLGGGILIDGKWKGGPEDLRQLRYIVDCYHLRLVGPQVSNDWLDAVAQMPSLRHLELHQTSVDDEGISKLLDAHALQRLMIRYSPVSDRVVDVLGQMDQLGRVEFEGTDVTPEGAQNLRERLANSQIDFRRGGFLGVGKAGGLLQDPGTGFRIGHVQPGSAAEKAGIRTGDIILKFNGEKVTNFDALRELIGKNKAGEAVDLNLLRNDEPLVVTVELGKRTR